MGRQSGPKNAGQKYGAPPLEISTAGTKSSGPAVGILIDGEDGENSPIARRPSKGQFATQQQQYGGYESRHAQAASQIGKVARGGVTRSKVANRYHVEGKPGEEPLHPRDVGLADYASRQESMPEVTEDLRFCVRDITARNVLLQLGFPSEKIGRHSDFEHDAFTALTAATKDREGLPAGVRKQGEMCRLFNYEMPTPPPQKDSPATGSSAPIGKSDAKTEGQDPAKGEMVYNGAVPQNANADYSVNVAASVEDSISRKYLLGKYECMAVPARADFDVAFEQIRRQASPSTPSQGGPSTNLGVGASTSPSATSRDPLMTQGPPTGPDCDGPDGFTGWFWVLHQGAPNIGESTQADDFMAYSREEAAEATPVTDDNQGYEGLQMHKQDPPKDSGRGHYLCWKDRPSGSWHRRLDEDLYLESMYHLWRLVLLAFARLGVEDGILFPFGMGAFIRHLGKNDDRYLEQPVMRRLRRRIADQLMKAIASVWGNSVATRKTNGDHGGAVAETGAKGKAAPKKSPARSSSKDSKVNSLVLPQRLHLCLMCHHTESVENHNVFIEAAGEIAKDHPGIADLLLIRRNVDVLQLAHDLSASSALKVGVLNGANRKLLGNHWFQSGARFAIDENLHRRSASLTRIALLLNMGTESGERRPSELSDTLKWLGGKVELASATVTQQRARPTTTGGGGGCLCCRRRNTGGEKPGATSKGSAAQKDSSKAASTGQGSVSTKSQTSTTAGGSKAPAAKGKGAKGTGRS